MNPLHNTKSVPMFINSNPQCESYASVLQTGTGLP